MDVHRCGGKTGEEEVNPAKRRIGCRALVRLLMLIVPAQNPKMSDRKQTATADEVAALNVLMSALEPFRAHNSIMPLQLAFTFLMAPTDEGRPVSEYARTAGMAPGVMARQSARPGELQSPTRGWANADRRTDRPDGPPHSSEVPHAQRSCTGRRYLPCYGANEKHVASAANGHRFARSIAPSR
jgi:hypothetical protein